MSDNPDDDSTRAAAPAGRRKKSKRKKQQSNVFEGPLTAGITSEMRVSTAETFDNELAPSTMSNLSANLRNIIPSAEQVAGVVSSTVTGAKSVASAVSTTVSAASKATSDISIAVSEGTANALEKAAAVSETVSGASKSAIEMGSAAIVKVSDASKAVMDTSTAAVELGSAAVHKVSDASKTAMETSRSLLAVASTTTSSAIEMGSAAVKTVSDASKAVSDAFENGSAAVKKVAEMYKGPSPVPIEKSAKTDDEPSADLLPPPPPLPPSSPRLRQGEVLDLCSLGGTEEKVKKSGEVYMKKYVAEVSSANPHFEREIAALPRIKRMSAEQSAEENLKIGSNTVTTYNYEPETTIAQSTGTGSYMSIAEADAQEFKDIVSTAPMVRLGEERKAVAVEQIWAVKGSKKMEEPDMARAQAKKADGEPPAGAQPGVPVGVREALLCDRLVAIAQSIFKNSARQDRRLEIRRGFRDGLPFVEIDVTPVEPS